MARGSVTIIGCGWLGRQLAQRLLSEGYQVRGSTRTPAKLPELEQIGIEAHQLDLSRTATIDATRSEEQEQRLWGADQLVIAIPPGRGAEEPVSQYGASVMSALLAYRRATTSGRVLFTSSVGVYGDMSGPVTESTAITSPSPRQARLLLAESQVIAQSQRPHLILRLGGLYGKDRDPGKQLAGRSGLARGEAPTNLVSGARVVEVMTALLHAPFWQYNGVVNVVDPTHPSRRERYTAYAKTHDLPLPDFASGGAEGKLVGSDPDIVEKLNLSGAFSSIQNA